MQLVCKVEWAEEFHSLKIPEFVKISAETTTPLQFANTTQANGIIGKNVRNTLILEQPTIGVFKSVTITPKSHS